MEPQPKLTHEHTLRAQNPLILNIGALTHERTLRAQNP